MQEAAASEVPNFLNSINSNVLYSFLSKHSEKIIPGQDKGQRVGNEIVYLYKTLASIDVMRCQDGHREEVVDILYTRVFRKILWLSSVCKEYTGEPFLTMWVDSSSKEEVRAVVSEFFNALRGNPTES